MSGLYQQTGELENGDAARLNSIILDLEAAIQSIRDSKNQLPNMATGEAADAVAAALDKQISSLRGAISSLKQVMKGV